LLLTEGLVLVSNILHLIYFENTVIDLNDAVRLVIGTKIK